MTNIIEWPEQKRWIGWKQYLSNEALGIAFCESVSDARQSIISGNQSEAIMHMHRAIGLLHRYNSCTIYNVNACHSDRVQGGIKLIVTLKLIRNTVQNHYYELDSAKEFMASTMQFALTISKALISGHTITAIQVRL